MSDDPFIYRPHDKDSWESAGDARIRQREIHEKRVAGEQDYQRRISGSDNSYSGNDFSGSYSSDSHEARPPSKVSLYVGIPLLILAYLLWQGHLPYGDYIIIGGYTLSQIVLVSGIICIAIRFFMKAAAIGVLIYGALGVLGSSISLFIEADSLPFIGTLILSIGIFFFGKFLCKRAFNL